MIVALKQTTNIFSYQSINQSNQIHIAPCRKRIKGTCWWRQGGVFTFTVSNVKQLCKSKIRLKVLRSSADLQLYDSE